MTSRRVVASVILAAALAAGVLIGRLSVGLFTNWDTVWSAVEAIATVVAAVAAIFAGYFAWTTLRHDRATTRAEQARLNQQMADLRAREDRRLLTVASHVRISQVEHKYELQDPEADFGRPFRLLTVENMTGQPIYDVSVDHASGTDGMIRDRDNADFYPRGPDSMRTRGNPVLLLQFNEWMRDNVAVHFTIDGTRITVPLRTEVPEIEHTPSE